MVHFLAVHRNIPTRNTILAKPSLNISDGVELLAKGQVSQAEELYQDAVVAAQDLDRRRGPRIRAPPRDASVAGGGGRLAPRRRRAPRAVTARGRRATHAPVGSETRLNVTSWLSGPLL